MFNRIIHSKLIMVDDRALSVGSANVNPRGFRLDTELNVMLDDAEGVRSFRYRLWSHNLGVPGSTVAAWAVRDFIARWDAVAKANERLTKTPNKMAGEGVIPFNPLKEAGLRMLVIHDDLTELADAASEIQKLSFGFEPGTGTEFDPGTSEARTGRWIRRDGVIILDDLAPTLPATHGELSRSLARPMPRFPAQPTASVGAPASLPVALFRPTPADPLTPNPKLEQALKSAIAKQEKDRKLKPGSFPVRFTLVDVTNSAGTFPSAGHLETVTDYIASEAKVAVMYSAYALRDMVRRFAAAVGANPANLFAELKRRMNPSIAAASPIIGRSLLFDEYRVPSYAHVFAVQPETLGRATVAFAAGFERALEGMIVPSNNADAGICVRGVGYGYLNGALAAAGVFEPSKEQGLWVAGDYQQGKKWPYVRIGSRNDRFVAQAGTTRDMAKLVALILTDRLLDPLSCKEMRDRLARAAKGPDKPWVARTGIFRTGSITHNKLGLGSLKRGNVVRSEVSVYQSPVTTGRRYVVAWQNLVGLWPIGWADIARIIKATITAFERP
jgi:hypothetical protein